MDILNHTDALACAIASGALDPALQLLLETQAAIQSSQSALVTAAEAAAGAMFEAQVPATMSAGALGAVLGRIDGADAADGPERRAARAASTLIDEILSLPRPVQDCALEAIGQGGWTFAGPGIRVLALPMKSDCKAEIIRIEPGWGAPRHGHGGMEYTLVMKGGFKDSAGHYEAGEIAMAGPGMAHSPVADRGSVCYALAVREAPAAFTGAMGLLQRMWRH